MDVGGELKPQSFCPRTVVPLPQIQAGFLEKRKIVSPYRD